MKSKGFKETIEWYDDNAKQYAMSLGQVIPIEPIDLFMSYLPKSPYILEAGCAAGRESKVFLEKGASITGIDLSENLLKIAHEDNPKATYVRGNFLDLPFEDESFDGVWSHASLVHLETVEEVKKALSEFNRVLKSLGILFIGVKAQIGNEKTAVVADTLSKSERFFRYFTEEEITELVEKTGFTIFNLHLREDGHGRKEVKWIKLFARKTG